jgi:hypothetical protein
MSQHVDLSVPGLAPDAVVALIKAHAEHRPPENILFKVSQSAFEQYRREHRVDLVSVTQAQADEINEFLGRSLPVDEYAMGARIPCENCGYVLTFYDVFRSGRGRHGDEFLRRMLAGGEYHLQVAGVGQAIEVECSNCRTVNHLRADDDRHTYHSDNYCYA